MLAVAVLCAVTFCALLLVKVVGMFVRGEES